MMTNDELHAMVLVLTEIEQEAQQLRTKVQSMVNGHHPTERFIARMELQDCAAEMLVDIARVVPMLSRSRALPIRDMIG